MTIPDEAVQAAFEAYGDRYRSIAAMQDALTAALPFLTGVKVDEIRSIAEEFINEGSRDYPEETCRSLKNMGHRILSAIEVSSCQTCKGRGIIGGMYRVGDGDVDGWEEPCPDCAPSPRAQALEEAARQAIERAVIELETNWPHKATPEMRDAIRALSPQPVADGLPQDVINLVIAAREAFDTGVLPEDEEHNLDKALEPFASHVLYENEPKATRPTGGRSHGE